MPASRKKSLLDEKSALERRLREINDELHRMNHPVDRNPLHSGRHKALPPDTLPPSVDRPLREIIISMLSETGYMLTNTSIRQLYEAQFQQGLAASRLGTLSHDEEHRKNKQMTTVYGLTHPIQMADKEITPVKNIWARSDWPLEKRIYLPSTPRLLNLYFLDWYITVLSNKKHRYLKSPVMENYIKGIVVNLGLNSKITFPFHTAQVKRIAVQEIERAHSEEEKQFGKLRFKILARHRKDKQNYDPIMDARTDFGV